jgi:hypothetical protein
MAARKTAAVARAQGCIIDPRLDNVGTSYQYQGFVALDRFAKQ